MRVRSALKRSPIDNACQTNGAENTVKVVDDLLIRRPEHVDGTTIGIFAGRGPGRRGVQYALRGPTTPLAISTYTNYRALPDDIRPALPSAVDLAAVVHDVRRQQTDR